MAQRHTVAHLPHIIAVGAPKAGTTSLHQWLSAHPQVCVSHLKEPYFFGHYATRPTNAPRWLYRASRNNDLDAYYRLYNFDRSRHRALMEATPTTLYAQQGARQIAAFVQHAYCVFTLRDPVQRTLSAFRFRKQLARLPADMTVDAFLDMQHTAYDPVTMPVLFGPQFEVLMSRYSQWIPAFQAVLPPERLIFVRFQDLQAAPDRVLRSVVERAGLDPAGLRAVDYTPRNISFGIQSPLLGGAYTRVTRVARHTLWRWNSLYVPLSRLWNATVDPLYRRVNQRTVPPITLTAAQRARFDALFDGERERTAALTGVNPPW